MNEKFNYINHVNLFLVNISKIKLNVREDFKILKPYEPMAVVTLNKLYLMF